MRKPLLDVIFASDKRKNVLLLLQDGPQRTEVLLDSMKTTRQALLPQIRILEEHQLVGRTDDSYELTTIGHLVVERMPYLLGTVKALEIDTDYWGTHDLNFIPPRLLERIGEIRNSTIVNPSVIDLHDLMKDFYETSIKSKSLNIATIFYHPQFIGLFADLIRAGISVRVIASEDMVEKSRTNVGEVLDSMIGSEFFQLWVYGEEMKFMSFAYNDLYMRMSPLTDTGRYDFKHLISFDQEAVGWARELFEHYLKGAARITDI
ncbi:hypothetical protein PV02_10555 [Methanolobus chelungpuianus]|uniref:Transcriptional regulator n=2 Tax=Methanolobus chelungpuianus TaxID=502115 RepID=A0AAE3HBY3_9EURY|nr:hypothetical protein [Methanolobus chelungpuianus]